MKRKMYRFILIITIVSFLLLSCSNESNNELQEKQLTGGAEGTNDTSLSGANVELIDSSMELLEDDAVTFLSSAVEVIDIDESQRTLEIYDYYPKTGSVGTVIAIEGKYLTTQKFENLMLDDVTIPVYNYYGEKIYGVTTSNLEPSKVYTLKAVYENNTYELGTFETMPLSSELLINETIDNIENEYYYSSDNISIVIPKGVLDQPSSLSVEKISDMRGNESNQSRTDSYRIKIGGQHLFSEQLSFELPLPEGYIDTGQLPRVIYFDESKGIWDSVFSEVTEAGMLVVRTNHLSLFQIIWDNFPYSTPEGHFTIYYHQYDTMNLNNQTAGSAIKTIDDLAVQVGIALEKARAEYERLLGPNYTLPEYAPLNPMVKLKTEVFLYSKYYQGNYTPLSGGIELPTTYLKENGIEAATAHELFHRYQNRYMDFWTMKTNLWMVESMAEYAAYRMAYGHSPHLWDRTSAIYVPGETDAFNEYSFSAFLDYMMLSSEKDHKQLFESFLKYGLHDWKELYLNLFDLDDYTEISDEYRKFWQELFTKSGEKWVEDLWAYIDKSTFVKDEAINEELSVNLLSPYNQWFSSYAIILKKQNVPRRFIRVTTVSENMDLLVLYTDNDLPFSKKATGTATSFHEVYQNGMTEDGYEWDSVEKEGSLSNYKTYEMDEFDLLTVALQYSDGEKTIAKISEVEVSAVTKSLDQVELGKNVEVIYGFSKIFDESKMLLVETDFGDGNVISKEYSNRRTLNISAKHNYSKFVKEIKGSLYDMTYGEKELIAQVVIPVSMDGDIKLEASDETPEIYEEVIFSLNIEDETYSYYWDMDDDPNDFSIGDYGVSVLGHSYDEIGVREVKVRVVDNTGKDVVTVSCMIEVVWPEIEFPHVVVRNYPSGNIQIVQTYDLVDGDTVYYRIEDFEDNDLNTPSYSSEHLITMDDALMALSGPNHAPTNRVHNGDKIVYLKDSDKIKSIVNYIDDQMHGLYQVYNDDGLRKSETPYVYGVIEGEVRTYYTSGNLLRESMYVNGIAEGSYKTYYDGGGPQTEGNQVNGKIHGIVTIYKRDGTVEYQQSYENGVFIKNVE